MNKYKNSGKSWNLMQFHKFCCAGSTGSVWNLDPGSRIRIRKSANQQKYGNMKIWKSGSLQIWKSKNLETWKLENLEFEDLKTGNLKIWRCGNLKIWQSENLTIWASENLQIRKSENLEAGIRESTTRNPLGWAAWAWGVEIRRPEGEQTACWMIFSNSEIVGPLPT